MYCKHLRLFLNSAACACSMCIAHTVHCQTLRDSFSCYDFLSLIFVDALKTTLYIKFMILWHDIFVNCNWVNTRLQQYRTHLHMDNTQNNTNNNGTRQITSNLKEYGPCPIFANFTLEFALQLRKKHGKTSAEYVPRIFELLLCYSVYFVSVCNRLSFERHSKDNPLVWSVQSYLLYVSLVLCFRYDVHIWQYSSSWLFVVLHLA